MNANNRSELKARTSQEPHKTKWSLQTDTDIAASFRPVASILTPQQRPRLLQCQTSRFSTQHHRFAPHTRLPMQLLLTTTTVPPKEFAPSSVWKINLVHPENSPGGMKEFLVLHTRTLCFFYTGNPRNDHFSIYSMVSPFRSWGSPIQFRKYSHSPENYFFRIDSLGVTV